VQVLVTDVTGVVGRSLARQLLAAGHAVVGIAENQHDCLDADVDFVRAPLSDALLHKLADHVDVVIHLASIDNTVPGGAGLGGVVRVTDAAARAGARLLFVSQAAGEPESYSQAEELVSSGWAPNLIVRVAPLVGRQHDWTVSRTVATLLRTKASPRTVRLLHLDDLIRFLVHAVATDRTGVVDLATPDTVDMATVHNLLRLETRQPHTHRIPSWMSLTPALDPAALHEDWKFECGWSAIEAIIDTARGLAGRRLNPAGASELSGRLPMPSEPTPRWEPTDGTRLRRAAPNGLEGEFDDRIDPRFPVFSAVGFAEALPGPLTPMTLDVQLAGLRAASREMGQVLALHGMFATEWESRSIAVFGHRPYIGVSNSAVLAGQLPGWDENDLAERALGGQPHDLFPLGRPRSARSRPVSAKAIVLTRTLAMLRHLKADTDAYRAAATADRFDTRQLAALSDARLEVRLQLLRDRIHQGWSLIALWVVDNGVTAAVTEHTSAAGPSTASGFGAVMESPRVAAEIASLADGLQQDPRLHALAADGDLAGVRAVSPGFAAKIGAAAARIAHRGPEEAELANPVFGDDGALLLTAVAAAGSATPTGTASARSANLPQRMVNNTLVSRETAYDATMRYTHELRMTLREVGARRVSADLIDVVDDVYYLTCDELLTMPSDARLRIKRRRAERERLQAVHLPDVVDRRWKPLDADIEPRSAVG
jgi:nucleoside-diphosphate-sugar epimerase